jgi:L-aspartate oxidase
MRTNFLVIGSGISGLNFALNAAKKGRVLIVTKKKIVDSNTNFAQGGIAAVLDKTDDYQKHISDTLKAGHYHNKKKAVEFMIKNSPDAIYRLIDLGVQFEKEKGKLKLTREGGHGKRRIAYVGDYTGKEIETVLVKRVREHPNIEILEDTFALELIVKRNNCYGCQLIENGRIKNAFADQTILATGGIGQLFSSTTNAKIATGDGIAMAIEAGVKTEDLEFIQFHPTAFDKNIFPRFLISETVRGEGGKIVNENGKEIMKGIHPQKDLAPRDIVAREIYKQAEKNKIYLDIRYKSKKYLQKRFPQIYKKLEKYNYKMEKDLIPITPAAHYECGGIKTNLKGKTKISRLFAFGEVAHTGVHGANRLASNSLLEALVFSNQILEQIKPLKKFNKINVTKKTISTKTAEAKIVKKEVQKIMWQYAGIIRNRKLIKKNALKKIQQLEKKLKEIKGINQDIAEAQNMVLVSKLIFKAILKRRKSLGCHFVD